jgi:CheY-like chemotaxis protein
MKQPEKGVILVVDDHPVNIGLLFEMLSKAGYRVLVAEGGVAAIERARKGKPDLILLDVMMPGMDGFQVCESLKSDPATSGIPIIFATALTDAESRAKALNLGADDFLSKPLLRQPTLRCIDRHLSKNSTTNPKPLNARGRISSNGETFSPEDEVFSSATIHDLRGALGGAFGFLEGIEFEMENEEPDLASIKDFLAWLRRSLLSVDESTRLISLQRSLTTYQSALSSVSLNVLLSSVRDRFSDLFPKAGVQIEGLSEADPVEISGDPFLLEEYFLFLLRALAGATLQESPHSKLTMVAEAAMSTENLSFSLTIPSRSLSEEEQINFLTPVRQGKFHRIKDVGVSLLGLQLLGAHLRLTPSIEACPGGNRIHFVFNLSAS